MGSGVAQALLEPQASTLEKAEEEVVGTAVGGTAALGADGGGGARVERLKTELVFESAGAGAGGVGF